MCDDIKRKAVGKIRSHEKDNRFSIKLTITLDASPRLPEKFRLNLATVATVHP